MKNITNYLVTILAAFLLASCGVAESNPPLTSEQIKTLEAAPVNPIALQGELSEMFAFGSKYTDLQRDIMSKKLIGSIVQWKLPVYDVSLSHNIYKIQTKNDIRIGESGSDLMAAIIFISPRNDSDRRLIESLKANDFISFKGKISEIVFRSYVVVEPAILTNTTH